jgi:hypothetical protein
VPLPVPLTRWSQPPGPARRPPCPTPGEEIRPSSGELPRRARRRISFLGRGSMTRGVTCAPCLAGFCLEPSRRACRAARRRDGAGRRSAPVAWIPPPTRLAEVRDAARFSRPRVCSSCESGTLFVAFTVCFRERRNRGHQLPEENVYWFPLHRVVVVNRLGKGVCFLSLLGMPCW